MDDYEIDLDQAQAAQHADRLLLQRQMLDALKAARERPLTEDESMLLAWGAGLSTDFYREIRQ